MLPSITNVSALFVETPVSSETPDLRFQLDCVPNEAHLETFRRRLVNTASNIIRSSVILWRWLVPILVKTSISHEALALATLLIIVSE